MIKSRGFAFIAVIAVAILLVVGNLVTPVQANKLDIVTQTPAGTPIVEPESLGETVSPEEQETIKAAIESYFEIRYRAFNTLQLLNFDELMSA